MPSDDASALHPLRRALAVAVDQSSLRQVARDVGMSPTGVRELLDGRWDRVYGATRRKLERWYLTGSRRRLEEAADDEVALVAVDALTRTIPGPEGKGFRAYVTAARREVLTGDRSALHRNALRWLLAAEGGELWEDALFRVLSNVLVDTCNGSLDRPVFRSALCRPRADAREAGRGSSRDACQTHGDPVTNAEAPPRNDSVVAADELRLSSPGEIDRLFASADVMLLHVYRVRFRATGTLTFPTFPGPALRGALGDDRAVYEALFRPGVELPQKRFADPPRPLMLRPRFGAGTYGTGSALELDLTLVGSAGQAFPALLRALVRLGEGGVGAGRHDHPDAGRFVVERVDALGPHGPVPVVTPGGLFTPAQAPWRFPDDFAAAGAEGADGRFVLELASPTFVRRRDEPRGSLAFRDLVDDLLKRVSLFGQAYSDGPVYARDDERALLASASDVEVEDAAVRWTEVPRFSRRQGSAMTFEGWMGWIAYRGDPSPWLPLLRAAEVLHLGKHTTFGLGEVRLAR